LKLANLQKDAIVIDNSDMNQEQTLQAVLKHLDTGVLHGKE